MSKLVTLGLLLAFAAIPAQGQELIFGANVGARWDSNVQNVPNGDSDFSARVGPEVRLRQEQGDLTYDFHYVPTYQAYSRFASLDDWDQLVNSMVTYQLGPATSLQVRDLFDYAPVTTNFLQQLTTPAGAPLGTQVINAIGRYNALINTASIDLKHQWSELWEGEATVSSFYYDPKIQGGISTNNTSAGGTVTYAITPRDQLGGALGFTAQQFGSNNVQSSTTSYFYNVSGVWNHEFSPTWKLNISAGPALADTGAVSTAPTLSVAEFPSQSFGGLSALFDFTHCPTVPTLGNGRSLLNLCGPPTILTSSNSPLVSSTIPVPVQGVSAGSTTNLTYFANILLTKQWETVTANLGFVRSAGSSGLFSSSTVINTVNGSLVWTESPVWTTSLSVYWTDQSNSSNQTIGAQEIVQGSPNLGFQLARAAGVIFQQQNNTINVYQWVVGLHSDYKLTKRLSIFGNFFYLNQTSSQQGGAPLNLSSLNYDATRIDLGFHYEFDPIHL